MLTRAFVRSAALPETQPLTMSGSATPRLSPSRMNDFLGCEYRTWIDIERAAGRIELDRVPRPDAELILERGRRHERRFLEELEAAGEDVLRLEGDNPAEQARLTGEAMRAGRGVIHQACFLHDGWIGYADFLVRVEEPSRDWGWSYEVHDAKLARHPKPNYIFQLLFYTDQVERIQGTRPGRMHLILGDGERPPFAPDEFDAYAAQVRAHFLARRGELAAGAAPAYPYPVADCDFCPWWKHCADKRRDDDHLSGVAQLQRRQGLRLEEAGVHTVTGVAELAAGTRVPRLAQATVESLRLQAGLQVRSRGLAVPLHELREFGHGRGFARLPAPSAGDVFFDFEGDPYWGDEGLEYLFGTVFLEQGEWRYRPLWAHDEAEERRAFEEWMRWITARLAAYPDMHVFHYNHYEPTALKRLMSRYGTCEHEVDELLRRQVFADLYTVVRQALRVGTASYGLKAIEALYEFKRAPELTGGAGAARTYEDWRETGDPRALPRIAAYNEDDCRSTLALRDWLQLRSDAAGFDLAALDPIAERELTDEQRARAAQRTALRDALSDPDDPARQRMADLIDYHRREEKPQWWAYFARLAMTPEELCDEDSEAIGRLQPAEDVPPREYKQSWEHPLRFPPQEWKLSPGNLLDPETGKNVNVVEIDDARGLVWVRRGKRFQSAPLPRAIAPGEPYKTYAQQDAIVAIAERVRDHGLERDAAVDLLAGRAPRMRAGAPALSAGPVDLAVLADQVASLSDSALFIQGPPGTGKTYTGGRVAAELMRRGLRVGVAATSHKAIQNLLREVEAAAAEIGHAFSGVKKSSDGNPESRYDTDRIRSEDDKAAIVSASDHLIAGTAWLWADESMRGAVDVLFVDEAGQVSLADAMAMSRGAGSVVLLGDPQQLAHVSQGTHPRGSGRSVLEHLLGAHNTVPPDRGVLLETTWRMHPAVCEFVSRTMYDGRLRPVDGCELQTVDSPGLSGVGLRMLEVPHADNRQTAPEEAERIAAEFAALSTQGRWRDRHGEWHELTLEDILVVAPYNAQVRCLKDKLPPGARVGTVDKFQGQQAPVVFFSMTSSSGEDIPRGMDFLFSRNRLNVAVSRAQALSVVVCSPRLKWARCAGVEQMRLVNMLCRFGESACASARP